ncbi:unnamed protein product [Parajaminaea phylloscopi]
MPSSSAMPRTALAQSIQRNGETTRGAGEEAPVLCSKSRQIERKGYNDSSIPEQLAADEDESDEAISSSLSSASDVWNSGEEEEDDWVPPPVKRWRRGAEEAGTRIKASAAQYRTAHREAALEQRRAHWHRHRERILRDRAASYRADPELYEVKVRQRCGADRKAIVAQASRARPCHSQGPRTALQGAIKGQRSSWLRAQ